MFVDAEPLAEHIGSYMSDRLVIHELVAECRIGVTNEERQRTQTLWIDLELEIDAARAAARDDVYEAVDYAELVSSVKQLIESKPYRLLETMAEDIASLVLGHFATNQVFVRVKKRALPRIDYAAVEVRRHKR